MANETVSSVTRQSYITRKRSAGNSIHNSASAFGGEFRGIFRVDEIDLNYTLHTGRSEDGIKWEIDPSPIKMKSADPEVFVTDHSYDPRITRLGDTYIVTWCNAGAQGPCIGLATTRDFKTFKQYENPLPPANRNCVIFPEKINGKYAMLQGPATGVIRLSGTSFIAESPDLVHWGCHWFVFGPKGGWQSTKVGPGPPSCKDEGTAGC
jgi:beta-1,4-mannooligosaccharide/beta-1,4-mannosyl-N-acetylglucosamine phosphorylase